MKSHAHGIRTDAQSPGDLAVGHLAEVAEREDARLAIGKLGDGPSQTLRQLSLRRHEFGLFGFGRDDLERLVVSQGC